MGHRATGDAKRRRLSRRSSSGKQLVDHAVLTLGVVPRSRNSITIMRPPQQGQSSAPIDSQVSWRWNSGVRIELGTVLRVMEEAEHAHDVGVGLDTIDDDERRPCDVLLIELGLGDEGAGAWVGDERLGEKPLDAGEGFLRCLDAVTGDAFGKLVVYLRLGRRRDDEFHAVRLKPHLRAIRFITTDASVPSPRSASAIEVVRAARWSGVMRS